MHNERQKIVLSLLRTEGKLEVDALAESFGVTGMTIRRDLTALEEEGLLTRTHGGCVPAAPLVAELPFTEKEQQHPKEKLAVCRKALRLIRPGNAIYLDTGTTCAGLASVLPGDMDLMVFTNNLHAAFALFRRNDLRVMVLGGMLGGKSPDLTGEQALSQISVVRFDIAFIGADAVDAVTGELFAAELGTALLSQAAQKQAQQVVACVDSSKFGRRGLARAAVLDSDLLLITDNQATPEQRRLLSGHGARVDYAGPGLDEK